MQLTLCQCVAQCKFCVVLLQLPSSQNATNVLCDTTNLRNLVALSIIFLSHLLFKFSQRKDRPTFETLAKTYLNIVLQKTLFKPIFQNE